MARTRMKRALFRTRHRTVFPVFLMSPPSNDRWVPPFDVTRVHFALSAHTRSHARTHARTHTRIRVMSTFVRANNRVPSTRYFGVFDDGCLEAWSWKPGDSEIGDANRVSMSLPLGN